MTRRPLREPLTELERELERDEATYAPYTELRERTRRVLDEDDDADTPIDDLREYLDASLVQAEAEHPLLTSAILRVIDTLNAIGI